MKRESSVKTHPAVAAPSTSAMRWWVDWVAQQEACYDFGELDDGEFYPSSMFDGGAPDASQCAAEDLMDLVTYGEDEKIRESENDEEMTKYVPYEIAGVRDQMGSTLFLFNDGSAIEFSLSARWWRVAGSVKMHEGHGYEYNAQTQTIERTAKRVRSGGNND